LEPASHFFYSHRLKLQFWDFGSEGKPPLILVHGSRDHARNWDWVAQGLRQDYHVYALDLRGHGNSAWAPGALYSFPEHVLDLAVFADIIKHSPISLIGHSLGAVVSLLFAGTYPERVRRLVAIEGLGVPPLDEPRNSAGERMRVWIGKIRNVEQRSSRAYENLAAAVARMQEANPFLSAEMARHLTIHGTNWNADGSLVWKFDQYTRVIPPFRLTHAELSSFLGAIACPTLLFWGRQSFARDPEIDPLAHVIPNHKIVKVDHAGHWLHHDQLEIFLKETKAFLAD
jgi:pimeloyl-ACP methyl ester carboxylesterase